MEKVKIKVAVEVNSTMEKVWDAWVNPEHMIHWNFASPDWHCPSASNDLSIGGFSNVRMEAKDGSFGFDLKCKYEQIELQKRLNTRMEDDRSIEVTFEEKDGMVFIVEVFEAETENSVELQQMGWQAILNNFKNYVEGL
ncbi:MAG: hypothetical protein RL138_1840 [Bacteroidota bacterium]|jgi:uncharacterized protein YndB with AHSA1/START domain